MFTLATAMVILVILWWTLWYTFPTMQCMFRRAAHAAGVVRLTGCTGGVTSYNRIKIYLKYQIYRYKTKTATLLK